VKTTQPKPVFTIIEAPNLEKDIFRRIGTAFVNRDESITVLLDALPLGGKLHIREPLPELPVSRESGDNLPT